MISAVNIVFDLVSSARCTSWVSGRYCMTIHWPYSSAEEIMEYEHETLVWLWVMTIDCWGHRVDYPNLSPPSRPSFESLHAHFRRRGRPSFGTGSDDAFGLWSRKSWRPNRPCRRSKAAGADSHVQESEVSNSRLCNSRLCLINIIISFCTQ